MDRNDPEKVATVLEASFQCAAALLHNLYVDQVQETFNMHFANPPLDSNKSASDIDNLKQFYRFVLTEPISLNIIISEFENSERICGVMSFFEPDWFKIQLSSLSPQNMNLLNMIIRMNHVCFLSRNTWELQSKIYLSNFVPNAMLETMLDRVEIFKKVCANIMQIAATQNLFTVQDMLIRAFNEFSSDTQVNLSKDVKSRISAYVLDTMISEYLESFD